MLKHWQIGCYPQILNVFFQTRQGSVLVVELKTIHSKLSLMAHVCTVSMLRTERIGRVEPKELIGTAGGSVLMGEHCLVDNPLFSS